MAITRADVTVQLIVDMVHLAPETVLLAWAAAPGRTILVTDAIAAAAAGQGRTSLAGVTIEVRGQEARRIDGTLAGSVLTMDAAVRNVIDLGVSPADALSAASSRPAALLGRHDLGVLRPGAPGNVVLDDDFTVRTTHVNGLPFATRAQQLAHSMGHHPRPRPRQSAGAQ